MDGQFTLDLVENTRRLESYSLKNREPEEVYVLGNDNFFTRENIKQGKDGEKVCLGALRTQFKVRDGYRIKHNDFGTQYQYCSGHGMDLKIYEFDSMSDIERLIAVIEIKNLSDQSKPYGIDFVLLKVLPRAEGIPSFIPKILLITYIKLLTKSAIELLHQEGWVIVETGEVLTSEYFQDLKKLYCLGAKIKSAIDTANKRILNQLITKTNKSVAYFFNSKFTAKLDRFIDNSINSNTVNTITHNVINLNNNQINNKNNIEYDMGTSNNSSKDLDVSDVRHEKHKEWLSRELERLKELDTFREID
jgi:hypothetical protein